MGVFMAEVYMCIYNWQEKKEENQASEYFCHAPIFGHNGALRFCPGTSNFPT
jgi:hypothetical protein